MLFGCEFSFSEWVSVGLLTSFIGDDVVVCYCLYFSYNHNYDFLNFLLNFLSTHLIGVVAMFFDLRIVCFTAPSFIYTTTKQIPPPYFGGF